MGMDAEQVLAVAPEQVQRSTRREASLLQPTRPGVKGPREEGQVMKTHSGCGSRATIVCALSLLLVVATVALAACGDSDSTESRSSGETAATTSPTAITPAAHEIQVFKDIRFLAARKADRPPLLDVYAPKQAGPWPLVVMLPGGFEHKETYMSLWATRVAERGAVVFVPDWIRVHETPPTAKELRAVLVGMIGDIAAAVRFARGTGARYGGDPGSLTLFGHSGGAMGATIEAFSRAPASKGGLKGTASTIPDALVVFDGDYLLGDPVWDAALEEDPGIMRVYTPWQYLGRRVDFPVTVIGSGDPDLSRPLGDPWAKDSWLAVRDPSGQLRRGLEGLDDLKSDVYLNEDMLKLFVQRLKAAGDAVVYVRLTDSTHAELGENGMEGLLDALVPSTQP